MEDYKKQLEEVNEKIKEVDGIKIGLKNKMHQLEKQIREEKLSAKEYSEQDLYDFALKIILPEYRGSRRLDIIQDWAKEAVEEFKKVKAK